MKDSFFCAAWEWTENDWLFSSIVSFCCSFLWMFILRGRFYHLLINVQREKCHSACGSADWPLWINLINWPTLLFCCQSPNQNVRRTFAPLLQAEVFPTRKTFRGREVFHWTGFNGKTQVKQKAQHTNSYIFSIFFFKYL